MDVAVYLAVLSEQQSGAAHVASHLAFNLEIDAGFDISRDGDTGTNDRLAVRFRHLGSHFGLRLIHSDLPSSSSGPVLRNLTRDRCSFHCHDHITGSGVARTISL